MLLVIVMLFVWTKVYEDVNAMYNAYNDVVYSIVNDIVMSMMNNDHATVVGIVSKVMLTMVDVVMNVLFPTVGK